MTDLEYRRQRQRLLLLIRQNRYYDGHNTARHFQRKLAELRKQYHVRLADLLAKVERARRSA